MTEIPLVGPKQNYQLMVLAVPQNVLREPRRIIGELLYFEIEDC